MQFTVTYFDGKTSHGKQAQASLLHDHILITYMDQDQEVNVKWDVKQIHLLDFYDKHKVSLKYGAFPHQYLETTETDFASTLQNTYRGHNFLKSPYSRLQKSGVKGLLLVFFVAIGLFSLIYFFVIPLVGESFARVMPRETEVSLGDAVFDNMVATEKVMDSSSIYVNRLFKKLKNDNDYDIRIFVVDDPIINAFALPGGRIVVYRGILEKMKSHEELVALLAHEQSHVQYRHTTRSLCRNLSNYIFISVLFGDVSGASAILIENGNHLQNLSYTRSLEEEADMMGLKLMVNNNIDPNGMVHLFERLQKAEGEFSIPQFLSSHPLTSERIAYVKKEIKAHERNYPENQELEQLFWQIKRQIHTE